VLLSVLMSVYVWMSDGGVGDALGSAREQAKDPANAF